MKKKAEQKKTLRAINHFLKPLNGLLEKFEGSYFAKNKYLFLAAILFGLILILSSKYLVVAWVDGKPITTFELYKNLNKRYGSDLREQMIVEKLLLSEAASKGVSASSDEVSNEIKKIEAEQGGAESLTQILSIQGISKDEFKNLVRLQLLRQKIFGTGVSVSDEEVNKYLEDNKNQYKEVTDKVKTDAKELLKQQKINSNFNNWLKDTIKSNRVKRV